MGIRKNVRGRIADMYYIVMYRRALVGVANALPFGLSSAMTDRLYWQLGNRWRT